MKFLIIGLGSMGKRRVRNLQSLGEKDILGLEVSEERRKEAEEKYGIRTFKDLDDALEQKPDALIISTPPHLHYEYMQIAIEKNIPFFTEINLIYEGLEPIVKNGEKKKLLMAASCDMRYIESIQRIKKIIDTKQIGKVVSFSYHVGQYLPDWHPWEDYRKFFGARKDTNACKELFPGELNWIQWIFGEVSSVFSLKGKFSSLEVNIDDVYQIVLNFGNKFLGHYLVEVVSRVPVRKMEIIGEEGTIIWDYNLREIQLFTAKEKKWTSFKEANGTVEKGYIHKEEPYQEEMKNFILALKKKIDYPRPLGEDLKILQLINAIEKSAVEKRVIEVTH